MALPPILHVDDAASWRGGEQQVLYLHQGLVARGIESIVVCREGGALQRRLAQDGLPYACLPLRGSYDAFSGWRLGKMARRRGALVHTHTSHAHSIALWGSVLGGRFPLVVSRRVDFPIGPSGAGSRKYLTDRVEAFLAISSGVEAALAAGGVPREKIRRVPSGIDLRRFDEVTPDPSWKASMGVPADAPLLGNVAALAPHKDQATLLDAFARYRAKGGRGHLVILGEGELRPALERRVRELDLTAMVHLPGFVDDVLSRMASLDVFVLSSYLEGLGTAILDALALGLPVVATAVGGVPDAIEDGRTGLLVPPRDPAALASAMLSLDADGALRQQLARAGREAVRSFDVRITIERTVEAYRELA